MPRSAISRPERLEISTQHGSSDVVVREKATGRRIVNPESVQLRHATVQRALEAGRTRLEERRVEDETHDPPHQSNLAARRQGATVFVHNPPYHCTSGKTARRRSSSEPCFKKADNACRRDPRGNSKRVAARNFQ